MISLVLVRGGDDLAHPLLRLDSKLRSVKPLARFQQEINSARAPTTEMVHTLRAMALSCCQCHLDLTQGLRRFHHAQCAQSPKADPGGAMTPTGHKTWRSSRVLDTEIWPVPGLWDKDTLFVVQPVLGCI